MIFAFRLYRKLTAPQIDPLAAGDDILQPVRQVISQARSFVQGINSAIEGRVLEHEFQMPLIIDALDQVPEVRSKFSYLGEGFFIDTPFPNAKGITRWRMRGRTFWTPILVNGVPVDGDAALKEFKEMIDDYFFPTSGATTPDYELYWFNLNAAVDAADPFGEMEWLIHPLEGVRIFQNSQKPLQRFFQFEFLGLQSNRDKQKAEDSFLKSLTGTSVIAGLLKLVGPESLASLVDGIFGTVKEIAGLINDIGNLAAAVNDFIVGAEEVIQYSIASVREILVAVQTVIGRIEDGVHLAEQFPNLIDEDITRLKQDYPGLVGSSEPGILALDEAAQVRNFLLGLLAQPQNFSVVLDGPAEPQTIAVQVPIDTTLERIAQAANADPTLIIQQNGLRYPFVDSRVRPEKIVDASARASSSGAAAMPSDGATWDQVLADANRALAWALTQPNLDPTAEASFRAAAAAASSAQTRIKQIGGVATPTELAALASASTSATRIAAANPSESGILYAGDVIRVPQPRPDVLPSIVSPADDAAAQILIVTGSPVTEEDRLFGIDLLLDDDGNLQWDGDRRDLVLSRGLANLQAAQVRYIKLPLGQLRSAPGIGNFAYQDLSRWQGPATNQLLAYSVFKSLSQDPRVKSISNMTVSTRRGVAILEYKGTAINGKDVPDLRVPVAAAA